MSTWVEWIDRRLYPEYTRNWDDWLFRKWILGHLSPEATVLDLGAGAGIVEAMDFKGRAARVCGVDLDPRVVSNPMLDEGKVADAGAVPYPDGAFDLVFADNVMEHLERPEVVFAELHRVLCPRGVLLFKTPNKTHYMPAVARMTPHRFHQFVNRLRGRANADTFPTRYRANTAATVRRLATQAGFTVERLERIEGRPEYLRMSAPTYLVGAAYERLVNAFECLAPFRVLIIAQLRKSAT